MAGLRGGARFHPGKIRYCLNCSWLQKEAATRTLTNGEILQMENKVIGGVTIPKIELSFPWVFLGAGAGSGQIAWADRNLIPGIGHEVCPLYLFQF